MTLHRHWPEVEKMLIFSRQLRNAVGALAHRSGIQGPILSEWTRSSRTRPKALLRMAGGLTAATAIARLLFRRIEILFLRAQHSRKRAQCGFELVDRRGSQRQPHAVRRMPGLTATSSMASSDIPPGRAATNACDRQCGGNVSHR